jgi:hypothetical protein
MYVLAVPLSLRTLDIWVPQAKKEDNPEEALKEFRAIVDQETEKGDWFVFRIPFPHDANIHLLTCLGVSKLSSSLRNFYS